jgi:hypothetical protein
VPERFVIAPEIREAFDITPDVVAWCVYWHPSGDEAECYRLHRDGLIEGETSRWPAFQELERLNYREMSPYNFGSSEEEPDYVVFVNERTRQTRFVPYSSMEREFQRLRELLQQGLDF